MRQLEDLRQFGAGLQRRPGIYALRADEYRLLGMGVALVAARLYPAGLLPKSEQDWLKQVFQGVEGLDGKPDASVVHVEAETLYRLACYLPEGATLEALDAEAGDAEGDAAEGERQGVSQPVGPAECDACGFEPCECAELGDTSDAGDTGERQGVSPPVEPEHIQEPPQDPATGAAGEGDVSRSETATVEPKRKRGRPRKGS